MQGQTGIREDQSQDRAGEPDGRSGAARWTGWPFLCALALLHILGLTLAFQPAGGLISAEPLIEQDYGLHYHHLQSMKAIRESGGGFWGYNPLFMAGYPSGTIQDASIKLFELIALPFDGDNVTRAFKLSIFAGAASIPWMAWLAGWGLFRDRRAAAGAAAMVSAAWWNSLGREMLFIGMIGFTLMAVFAPMALGLMTAMGNRAASARRRAAWIAAWFAACAVALPLHVQGIAIAGPPAAAWIIARRRQLRPGFFFALAGGLSFGLAVNLPWLMPFVSHRGDSIAGRLVGEVPVYVTQGAFDFIRDYASATPLFSFRAGWAQMGLRWTLLVLGVAGARSAIRRGDKPLGAALAVGIGWLFALAYFGSLVPALRGWQPLRFKAALDVMLAISAAGLLIDPGSGRAARWTLGAVAGLGAAAFAFNVARTEASGAFDLRVGIPPAQREIVAWIARETPPEARVLFEASGDGGVDYGGMYLSAFVPHLTGRELIGGPANLYNDRHHFAQFASGRLYGRPIGEWSDAELTAWFDLHDIGAIFVHDPRSVERLLAMGDSIEPVGRMENFALMRVRRTPNRFIEGSGRVRARPGEIRLTELEGDAVTIKYHWIEGLRAEPHVEIQKVLMLDDPIPFIRLVAPPREVRLSVKPEPRPD